MVVSDNVKRGEMDFSYGIAPFVAWVVAGVLKFAINSVRAGQLAFGLIGYGGLPSNHSAIVSSMAVLIAFKEGLNHPAFGISVTLAFIVMLDATSLRREVGRHSAAINKLIPSESDSPKLRERMGHTPLEIVAGILVGIVVGASIYWF